MTGVALASRMNKYCPASGNSMSRNWMPILATESGKSQEECETDWMALFHDGLPN